MKASVRITFEGPEFKVLSAHVNMSHVDVEVEGVSESNTRVKLTAAPGKYQRRLNGMLAISTSCPAQPIIEIPVIVAEVSPPLAGQ